MRDFLEFLAERKYWYYQSLYKTNPFAYTEEECVNRLQKLGNYKELITVIDQLPVKEKIIVDQLFDEKVKGN